MNDRPTLILILSTVHACINTYIHMYIRTYQKCNNISIYHHIVHDTLGSDTVSTYVCMHVLDAMIHGLGVSIYYCFCITIQRYIVQYSKV